MTQVWLPSCGECGAEDPGAPLVALCMNSVTVERQ